MNLKERLIVFSSNFIIFSQIWYQITMFFTKFKDSCVVPIYKDFADIKNVLSSRSLYISDKLFGFDSEHMMHPRRIQCRLNEQVQFGDCDDHAIYWCTAIKKSKLAKKVWFAAFQMKSNDNPDKFSGHAVCVFMDFNGKYYWCDYRMPELIEKREDFMHKSAKRYNCTPIVGITWEIDYIKEDDTPVFGKINRFLP